MDNLQVIKLWVDLLIVGKINSLSKNMISKQIYSNEYTTTDV